MYHPGRILDIHNFSLLNPVQALIMYSCRTHAACWTLTHACLRLAHAGKYELIAVLTHKGRSVDSGHYVAWVKQQDKTWMLFDDADLIPKKEEDILALCGGGDWHMAYLLIYKAITVPDVPEVNTSKPAATA